MLTDRDILILRLLALYGVLSRVQIQKLVFPNDGTQGRIPRRRLQMLVAEGYARRYQAQLLYPSAGPPVPAYHLAAKGASFLAEYFHDDSYFLVNTQTPPPHHVYHWVAVAETHLRLRQAVERQHEVQLLGWINEWDQIASTESAADKRYRLFQVLAEKPRRLVVSPDSAFLLGIDSDSKIYLLEQDRATSGARQEAFSKTPGHAELYRRGLYKRYFPEATIAGFTVLCISPNENRREAMRRAFHGRPSWELWRFASMSDVTPEKILHAPIFFRCDDEPPEALVSRGE